MIKQVNVIALFVRDLERSLTFYRDTLDMTVKTQEEGFAELALEGGPAIALIARATASKMISEEAVGIEPKGGHSFTFAAYLDNADDAYEKLKAKGVTFIKPPTDQPWGQRTAYFEDPDGNLWEISHWASQ